MTGFLFDENLPRRLRLNARLPILHTEDLGASPPDGAVWTYAKARRLAIVTKDADFSGRLAIAQPPPWVVHLRVGNLRRRDLETFLEQVWPEIEALLPAYKLVNVYPDRLETLE